MLALIIFCILFTWLACAAVCIGIGALLLRGFRYFFSPLDALWTGLALITAILQLYHFFRPIDLLAVYLLVGMALTGWIWSRTSLLQQWRERKKPRLAAALLLIAAAAIIAFRCAALGEHYDTGLYGAQAVRWFITYPLVPGLGNLIGQLGFNSSVFLWFAALEQGPWCGLAHHLFDGFIIAALRARHHLGHHHQDRRHQHRPPHQCGLPRRRRLPLPRSRRGIAASGDKHERFPAACRYTQGRFRHGPGDCHGAFFAGCRV